MNWITEIFSSPSEQARLATTIIAAIIAVTIVLINQWFNSRRSKNEKIIEKIEETYKSIIKLEEIFFNIHNEIISNYQHFDEQKSKSPSAIFETNKAQNIENHIEQLNKEFYINEATAFMLSGLYFPCLKQDIKLLKNSYQELFLAYITSESFGEYIDASKEHIPPIEKSLKNIYKILSDIMNKHMHNKTLQPDP